MALKPYTPIDAYVGSRVRMQRNLLGMSQEKLADQLGITFQQVQKYEKGANRIGASRLYAISKILRVEISYFFDNYDDADSDLAGLEQQGEHTEVAQFLVSREGLALVRAFSKIGNPKIRRSFVELAKTLGKDENALILDGPRMSESDEKRFQ